MVSSKLFKDWIHNTIVVWTNGENVIEIHYKMSKNENLNLSFVISFHICLMDIFDIEAIVTSFLLKNYI